MTTQTIADSIISSTEGDRFVGYTKDREQVYVSIELRHHAPEFTTTGAPIVKQTTDHRDITEYTELAITGVTIKHRTYQSAGQIVDVLNDIDMQDKETTITREQLRQLRELWSTCHLNGMHAGCIHQDRNAHAGQWDRYDTISAEQTAKCPEGYKYGSRWLVQALTDEQRATADMLIAVLRGQKTPPVSTRG